MKTVFAQCPRCKNDKSFNLFDTTNNILDIKVKWFRCSFCSKNIAKEKWIQK